MMTTRTFCSATVLALAIIIESVAPGHAGDPCCDWVYGKYINLKTGKEVKPPTRRWRIATWSKFSRPLQIMVDRQRQASIGADSTNDPTCAR
jgi:hypothetical protein